MKNQFRTLDEDEIEFLDSVLESTRAQEAAVTKETMEQLELFHRQREEAAKAEAANANLQDIISPEEQNWTTVHRKKRRREIEPLPGAKLRKRSTDQKSPTVEEPDEKKKKMLSLSAAAEKPNVAEPNARARKRIGSSKSPEETDQTISSPAAAATQPAAGLGLDAYSSDED